jgi:hypothetical protein
VIMVHIVESTENICDAAFHHNHDVCQHRGIGGVGCCNICHLHDSCHEDAFVCIEQVVDPCRRVHASIYIIIKQWL